MSVPSGIHFPVQLDDRNFLAAAGPRRTPAAIELRFEHALQKILLARAKKPYRSRSPFRLPCRTCRPSSLNRTPARPSSSGPYRAAPWAVRRQETWSRMQTRFCSVDLFFGGFGFLFRLPRLLLFLQFGCALFLCRFRGFLFRGLLGFLFGFFLGLFLRFFVGFTVWPLLRLSF